MDGSAILSLLLSLVTGTVWVATLIVALRAWVCPTDQRSSAVLLSLLCLQLLFVRLSTWPVLLWQLQQLVPTVPGAMCGFGVLQATPELTTRLFLGKALSLAFATWLAATWWALRLSRQRTGRIVKLGTFAALGFFGFDVWCEVAFVLVERADTLVSCCTTILDVPDRSTSSLPNSWFGPRGAVVVLIAYAGLSLGFAMLGMRMARGAGPSGFGLFVWGLGAALVTGLAVVVFVEWLTPAVLHLPHHHCPVELWSATLDGPLLFLFVLGLWCLPWTAFGLKLALPSADAGAWIRRSVRGAAWCAGLLCLMVLTHLAVAEWMQG